MVSCVVGIVCILSMIAFVWYMLHDDDIVIESTDPSIPIIELESLKKLYIINSSKWKLTKDTIWYIPDNKKPIKLRIKNRDRRKYNKFLEQQIIDNVTSAKNIKLQEVIDDVRADIKKFEEQNQREQTEKLATAYKDAGGEVQFLGYVGTNKIAYVDSNGEVMIVNKNIGDVIDVDGDK